MRKTAIKLGISVAAMPLSILLLGLTHNSSFFLSLLAGLLFSILYWFDLGQQLRNIANPSRPVHFLGIIMGVPQALFGFVCFCIGTAICIFALYMLLTHRSEFRGGFFSFGIGPALILFGLGWLISAFRADPIQEPADPAESDGA